MRHQEIAEYPQTSKLGSLINRKSELRPFTEAHRPNQFILPRDMNGSDIRCNPGKSFITGLVFGRKEY